MRSVVQIVVIWSLALLPLLAMGEEQASYTPSFKAPFALKGEWMGGVTLSAGSIDSDNSTLLLFIEEIGASGGLFSVQPFGGYFYTDNRCVGVRLGYTRFDGEVSSSVFDLGESNDMTFDIPQVASYSNSYKAAIFHRSYASMDRAGRFALFADLESGYTYASSQSQLDESLAKSCSHNFYIDFNPGLAFYLFPNVATTFSMGLGGFDYTRVEQLSPTTDEVIGSKETSQLSFKLNIIDINFGIVFHFWGGK